MPGFCAFDGMAVTKILLWVLFFPPLKLGAGPIVVELWLAGSLRAHGRVAMVNWLRIRDDSLLTVCVCDVTCMVGWPDSIGKLLDVWKVLKTRKSRAGQSFCAGCVSLRVSPQIAYDKKCQGSVPGCVC